MSVIFDQVTIVGVGLIGGSLGMAIKKHGLAKTVIGVDITEDTLELACQLQAIDEGTTNPINGVKNADLLILAAPISTNIDILRVVKDHIKSGCIVTDVGSSKAGVVKSSQEILDGKGCFIGGHPMAGSEIGGVKGADPYLFENAVYILTPVDESNEHNLSQLKSLVTRIGAKLLLVDPDEHDMMVAAISHLPHLIASTLVNAVASIDPLYPQALSLAAGGFRDTTRIASGSPTLWRDICFSNRDRLLQMIDIFRESLDRFYSQLERGEEQAFSNDLELARQVRAKVPAKLKGYWPFLEEVIVMIPDKPGMIGDVAAILGEAGINIDDIEILRVREGEGGSLRLGFASPGAGEIAVQTLGAHGFIARLKG